MKLIINYLGAGRLEIDKRHPAVNIVIGNFSDITTKIIPFFEKYPVLGVKHLDFLDWAKIANLMLLGKNKTSEGLEEIKLIEKGMNKGRK